ncbi:lipopolysaccharide export system permease protein [Nitrosospira multiformis]|uniref:Lipopolysaccharide export system permease protein LptF n=2 Tax=Nitrosospira multiformis TaxID=1231 RepID=A0A2T5II44_9PROT|nr:lipopolysaccharide export system permease protein [Nitrosospira multiformis]
MVVTVILATLFASFSTARFLAGAVTDSLGLVPVLRLVFLKTLIALEVLMPIALYVAVIMGLGRLHRDQEIVVLRSAGVSEHRIIYAVLIVAVPVGLISGFLSIFARPWAYEESYLLNAQAEAELNTERFRAGRFYGSEKKGRVIYVKDSSGKQMGEVFHYLNKHDSSEIILARKAYQPELVFGQRPQIHLLDGSIYRLSHTGKGDTVVQFEKLVYFTDSGNVMDYRRKAAPTAALMQSDLPRDTAELQWRLSRPLGTILLALIAVPFSRASPRQTKGDKTYYLAALVFAIYYILSGLAQTWVEQGTIGRVPGVWWLYGVMLLFAISLLSPGFRWKLLLRR